MGLPLQEQALLVERLLATFDLDQDIDVEEQWLREAKRRHREYRTGKIRSKPANEAFEEAAKRVRSTDLSFSPWRERKLWMLQGTKSVWHAACERTSSGDDSCGGAATPVGACHGFRLFYVE
jgi:Putative addiction module component